VTVTVDKRARIAIIGGGVAGLRAGHLLAREFEPTLFEKEARLGGNAYTFTTRDGQEIDIAVAAFGRAGYERTFRMLAELGIPTRPSAGAFMSCHDLDGGDGIYMTPTLRGLHSQRFGLLRPRRLRALWRLSRELASARKIQEAGGFDGLSVREGLRLLPGISGDAETIFLCALCLLSSMSAEEVLEAPARFFFGKLAVHHDVLSPEAVYSVRTLPGGTRSYVNALAGALGDRVVRNARIRTVLRDEGGIRILFEDGGEARFDKAVFACNPDQALALLEAPTSLERQLLSAWRYREGRLVVHRDHTAFPRRELMQAYTFLYRRKDGAFSTSVNGSLWFEPGTPRDLDLIASQHPNFPIREDRIELDTVLRTPIFDFQSCSTTATLPALNGVLNTYYCGSYFGFGLHEDAIRSAEEVARTLGVEPLSPPSARSWLTTPASRPRPMMRG
jgi:predicted NAD/FAD-binding protein